MKLLNPKLRTKLEQLEMLNHIELSQKWNRLHSSPPPKASSRKFLLRALSYELQIKASVRLPKADQKALHAALSIKSASKLVSDTEAVGRKHRPVIKLVSGSRLVREWNGKVYTVSIIEDGFVYKDKVWASLSAIARDITSAHWSGPRFFGVNGTVQ